MDKTKETYNEFGMKTGEKLRVVVSDDFTGKKNPKMALHMRWFFRNEDGELQAGPKGFYVIIDEAWGFVRVLIDHLNKYFNCNMALVDMGDQKEDTTE